MCQEGMRMCGRNELHVDALLEARKYTQTLYAILL
jgi:hypothetical protein